MNKEQFKKAVRILAKGCDIAGHLHRDGAYCALGDLLHAAGVPDNQMRAEPNSSQSDLLAKEYGLNPEMESSIIVINDNCEDVCERRKKVIGYLKDCVSKTENAKCS